MRFTILRIIYIVGIAAAFSPSGFSQIRWEKTNGPYGGTIRALAVDNYSGIVYASIYYNGVYRTLDQGATWQPANCGLENISVRSLTVDSSTGIIYAGTFYSGIYRSEDQGSSWNQITSSDFETVIVQTILVLPGGILLAGTTGGMYRSFNNGETWESANTSLLVLNVSSLVRTSTGALIIGTTSGIFLSYNYGDTWNSLSNSVAGKSCSSIIVNPRISNLVLFGMSDGVYLSFDDGVTCTPTGLIEAGLSVQALCIDPVDGAYYAGSDVKGLYKSTDGGVNWKSVSAGIPTLRSRSLLIDKSETIYAGFLGAGIFRSTDGGASWTEQNQGLTGTSVYALDYHPIAGLLAGTPYNGLFHSTDFGINWLHIGNEVRTLTINSIFVYPNGSLFAATRDGIYLSTNNGDNWALSNNGFTAENSRVQHIVMSATGNMYAQSISGVYVSSDTGKTWTSISSALPAGNIYSMAITPTGSLFVVVDTLGIYRSKDNGTTWTHLGAGITAKYFWDIFSSTPSIISSIMNILLVGTDVGIFRSTDNGETWVDVMLGPDINSFKMGPRELIFCATSTDGVFISDDNGISWYQTNENLTRMNVWSFGFSSSGMIFVGTDGDGVWRGIPAFAMISVPQRIQFQSVAIGAFDNRSVMIQNVGGESLQIDSVKIEGANQGDFSMTEVAVSYTIQPDDNLTIMLRFTPTANGIRDANLRIYSNDPTLEIASIPLQGIGLKGPKIAVQDTLQFGTVLTGQYADLNLSIQSIGTGDLRIDSMRVQPTAGDASEFQIMNVVYPLLITNGTSQEVTLRWTPRVAGSKYATVVIFNNDPNKPMAEVALRGTAIATPKIAVKDTISFGTVLKGLTADQNFSIQNTGLANLRIDSARIQMKTGTASEFILLSTTYPFIVTAGTEWQVTIRWSPESEGISDGILTLFCNDPIKSAAQIVLRGVSVVDKTPPLISDVNIPTTKTAGSSITIVANASDASGIKDFYVGYRTGKGPWQQATFDRGTAPPSAIIPGAAVTTNGIDYRIIATDIAGGNKTVLNGTSADVYNQITIVVPTGTFSYSTHGGSNQTDYRIFSVPLTLDDQTASHFFSGQNSLGSVGTEWRLFRYLKNTGYEEWDASNDFNLLAGNSFMLITSKSVSLSNTGGGALSLGIFRIQGGRLAPGWNFVGDPFPYQVALSDLTLEPALVDLSTHAFYYTGSGSRSGWEFGTSAGLKPWEGLAIQVNDSCLLKLKNPDGTLQKNSTAGQDKMSSAYAYFQSTERVQDDRAGDDIEWVGQIIASDDVSFDKITYFGVNSKAAEENNPYVLYEPPALPNTVSLFFANPKNPDASDRIAADIKPFIENGLTWDLELRAAAHTMVRCEFKNLQKIPSRFGVYLFDAARKALYDMRQQAFRDIYSADGTRSLKLIVGEESYVAAMSQGIGAVPAEYALAQNYPNPFNPLTLIRYQIPEAGHVTLTLYSVIGQEVMKIVDTDQSAGYYDVMVNASSLSSGIYFYRLSMNGTNLTKKMTVIR